MVNQGDKKCPTSRMKWGSIADKIKVYFASVDAPYV